MTFERAIFYLAMVCTIGFSIGGLQQCHYDHELKLKSLDKCGAPYCEVKK